MASGSQNNTTYQAQKWTNLRAFTIGNTAKNVDGTAAVSWSKDEILGASTDAYFLRGDKTWSNSLSANFSAGTYILAGTYLQARNHMYLDAGHFYMKYSNTWYSVLHNHGNGNISVEAASGGLYIGYSNTTLINWLNGKMSLDSNGNLTMKNDIYYQGTKSSNRMIRFLNNSSGTDGNGIIIGGAGYVGIGSGESGDQSYSGGGYSAGSETLVLSSDGDIRLLPTQQDGYNVAYETLVTTSGLWVGKDGNTTREMVIAVRSGAGTISLWSAAAVAGDRGLWLTAHGSGGGYAVVCADTNNVSYLQGHRIGIKNTDSASGYGLSLYNGQYNGVPEYGMFFGGTGTFGKFGDVSADWATYFTMNRNDTRGWIFKSNGTSKNGNYNVASISGRGHFTGTLSPSSWIDGQRYTYAAYNIADYSNTGSYNPWMRATNTWSSGAENAKVGRWFSFGTLGTRFHWIGSTTTRTNNSYDNVMTFDISNGALYANGLIQSGTGFADHYNGSATKLAYSQTGLAASAMTWFTCWNGYELRAISKAETMAAVRGAASGSWGISVTGSSGSCTGNAATATTASYANVINNDGGRRASSEYMHADGKIRFYLATSSMTTGKPPCDGFIMKGGWDNAGGWDSMFAWGNDGHGYIRGSTGSGNSTNHTQAWRAWNTLLDSSNYTSYTVTKTGSGASGTWGINVTGSSGSCTGNAKTATTAASCSGNAATASKVGETNSWLYFNHSNEVNFGGANTSGDIYFGYRAIDSRPKPTNFIFGTGNGTATVKAATFIGALTGNASTATTLQTARNINGTSFNGSANITTANWGTARNFTIKDYNSNNAGTAVSVNGSGAVTLLMPSTIYCSDVRSGNTRIVSDWIGFYQSNNAGGKRYGYIECDVNRMYFRKENSSSQTHYFDFGSSVYIAGELNTGGVRARGGMMALSEANSGNCAVWFVNSTNTVSYWKMAVESSNNKFVFYRYDNGTLTSKFWINSNGTTGTSSSRKVKHDIQNINFNTGYIIDRMQPVSYIVNNDPKNKTTYGFIYEDLVQILPNVCDDNGGGVVGITYTAIIPVLVKELQSLRKRLAAVETELNYYRSKI